MERVLCIIVLPYTHMVSLISKKKARGKPQWYAVKSKRIKGKSRIVWQKYLGTAESIIKLLEANDPTMNYKFKSFSFGRSAAIQRVNEDLGFVEAVDRIVEKKKVGGLTVGQYLLIQIMGRAEEKYSRQAISEWFPSNPLKIWFYRRYKSNAQNFLNQLDYVGDEISIRAIEDALCSRLIEMGLKPSILFWDTSNFFTEIQGDDGDIPKKGKGKEKRNDKNLVGVGLLTSNEKVPMLHETYPGNKHDSKVMSYIIDRIVARLKMLKIPVDGVVVVFDCGNNSEANIKSIRAAELHLVGKLKASQGGNLFDVPLDDYSYLYLSSKKHKIYGYRIKKHVYDDEYSIVVSFNEGTAKRKMYTHEKNMRTAHENLEEMKEILINPPTKGRSTTKKGAEKKARDMIPKAVRDLFEIKTRRLKGKRIKLTWEIDTEREEIWKKRFGKRLIFTDQHEWSSEQIVKTYDEKYLIEEDFKFLKDKVLFSFKPMFVRTDSHIRAHVFLCVTGLLFYRYMAWTLRDLNMNATQLVGVLKKIRLALVRKKTGGTGKFVVEDMDREEAEVFTRLRLSEFLPE
jgi:transposase